jgi:hypothetical protein
LRTVLGVGCEVNVTVVRMANQRGTFSKRRREQELQERARAKLERRSARRDAPRAPGGGPQIAWDEAVYPEAAETSPAEPTDPVEGGAPGGDPPA